MQITVDAHLCSGQGRCYSLAPELLSPDDEGFVTIRGQTVDVPAEHEGAARTAMNACPEDAISISGD